LLCISVSFLLGLLDHFLCKSLSHMYSSC
jgi:hypothetical protein